ncbi:MAG TPA: enoyl-CoA hydratase-related protein, partial [Candidatus Competibacteraceae bacterium]|nr:enoyl-CoA hydratase-related protein [Candidatus Competibacteraceae bacterium]
MSAASDCLFSHPRPGVLLVTLNRPEARNALRTPLLAELAAALQAAAGDDAVRCVVLSGGPA